MSLPTRSDARRLQRLYARRRLRGGGGKHIPPLPGEYVYYDSRLEDSGYWTIRDIPCHFSCPQKRNFGPFVRCFGRQTGIRSAYVEIDAPQPRPCPRPTLVDPRRRIRMRSVSPDFVNEGARLTGYASDNDDCT